MKKYFLFAVAAILLTGSAALAQNNNENPNDNRRPKERTTEKGNKELKEYDEIIIKRKDPKVNTKITIEIKDDKVLVDGKSIDTYSNEDVVIMKRSPRRYELMDPPSPFQNGGNWLFDDSEVFNDSEPLAFLGVSTEGTSGGARIVTVSENSAAAKAGLMKNDIITKIDDKAVFDHEQITELITKHKPEDKVTIVYKRDGKENTATVTLGARQRERRIMKNLRPQLAPMPPMEFNFEHGEEGNFFNYKSGGKPRLGLKAQDTEDGKGVKVLDVDEGSPAEKAGIRENDIITSFEGKDVNSAEELSKASREAKDKTSMKVQLKRNGKTQNVEVKVPKKLKTATL